MKNLLDVSRRRHKWNMRRPVMTDAVTSNDGRNHVK